MGAVSSTQKGQLLDAPAGMSQDSGADGVGGCGILSCEGSGSCLQLGSERSGRGKAALPAGSLSRWREAGLKPE